MTKRLQDALRTQKKRTQKSKLQIVGTLGIPLGGERVVEVSGRNSFVYVKLRDNQSEVIQAFNNKVAPSYGLPVIVERNRNRYEIVAVDSIRYQSNWNSSAPFLPKHGNSHSFSPDTRGGGDVVWVYPRQMMPALVTPSGSSGAGNVIMSSYTIKNEDGSWKYVGSTGTQSLLPYKPSIATGAVMALVYLDSISGNPYLLIGSGSYFHASITGTAQITPYIPSLTNPSHIPLAAVRLVTGTFKILWSNIYDARQWIHTIPTGTGGSVAAGTGFIIQDEGVSQGVANTLNFVGTNVDASVAGGVARIFITGSSGGISNLTGTSIGTPNAVVLTNSSGHLYTDPQLKWNYISGKLYAEMGANVANKEANAGRFGYEIFTSNYMDWVGAGTGSGARRHRFYDITHADVVQGGNIQNLNLKSTWIYHNATGTEVGPVNAPEKTYITGSDYLLGLDGENSFNSVRFPATAVLPAAETNAADVFRCDNSGASTFAGTIATLPGGSTLTYNVTSGNENAMVPTNTNQLAKMRLYNTTRGTSALISNCNTGTNTITLTDTVPAGWATTDVITIASQTVSGGGFNWVDLEITSGPTGKDALFFNLQVSDTTTTNVGLRLHPFNSFSNSKIGKVLTQVVNVTNDNMVLIPIIGNVFSAAWNPSGAASMIVTVREAGYIP